MMSERVHDGHDRTPETWFKRAATVEKLPEQGGAKKTNTFQGREWIDALRELWAVRANQALEREGREERIDHRSHAERGLAQLPTVHEGPNVRQMHARGLPGDRVEMNQAIRAANAELGRLDWLIEKTKAAMSALAEKVRARAQAFETGLASVNARFEQWQQDRQRAQQQKQETERQQEQQHRGPQDVTRVNGGL